MMVDAVGTAEFPLLRDNLCGICPRWPGPAVMAHVYFHDLPVYLSRATSSRWACL